MAEITKAPGKGAAGVAAGLKKKVGPLPTWAWALVLIGAYVAYRYYKGGTSSDPGAAAGVGGGLDGGGTGGGGSGQAGGKGAHHKPPTRTEQKPCRPGYERDSSGKCHPIGHGAHHGHGGGGGGGGGGNHQGGGGGGQGGGGGGQHHGGHHDNGDHDPNTRPTGHQGGGIEPGGIYPGAGSRHQPGHGTIPGRPRVSGRSGPVRGGRPMPDHRAPHPQDHGR